MEQVSGDPAGYLPQGASRRSTWCRGPSRLLLPSSRKITPCPYAITCQKSHSAQFFPFNFKSISTGFEVLVSSIRMHLLRRRTKRAGAEVTPRHRRSLLHRHTGGEIRYLRPRYQTRYRHPVGHHRQRTGLVPSLKEVMKIAS